MKRMLMMAAVFALLLSGCSGTNSDETTATTAQQPGATAQQPGAKVTLSETLQFSAPPNAVIPYGTGPALELTNLQLSPDGDFVAGKVDFAGSTAEEFTLVTVLSLKEEILFEYFDPDTNLTLHLPSGMVLLGAAGYAIEGSDQGSITFSVSRRVFNGFDVSDPNVTARVFTVPGKVYSNSIIPGDQTVTDAFQANSSVLTVPVDLTAGG